MSSNDQRNWLERLGDRVPGYRGYVDKERRRDVDKMHREHLADRIRRLKDPLNAIMKEMTDGGRLFEVGPVDTAIKKLDKLENRIRFASYGYSGFFDVVKIQENQLDAIYRFDLAMVEHIDKIEAKLNELKSQSGTGPGLKSASAELAASIDEADRAFDQRYQAINNFGQNEPPGKPLFS